MAGILLIFNGMVRHRLRKSQLKSNCAISVCPAVPIKVYSPLFRNFIPDYQSLMLPVLEIATKGETSVPLTEADIATRFGLSDAEREELLPSGKQRVLHNRIHWAKFYLTKAGFC